MAIITALLVVDGVADAISLYSHMSDSVNAAPTIGLAYIVWGACIFATTIPFAVFLYRANQNARALRPRGKMQFSPASMLWWYAVPFLNLIRPYQAVQEVWEVSTPKAEDVSDRSPVAAWWALFVLNEVVPRLFMSSADRAIARLGFGLGAVLGLPLVFAAARMVRALHLRQRARASELRA